MPIEILLRNGAFDGRWNIAPERTTVRLATRSVWGLMPVRGTFKQVSGYGSVASRGAIAGRVRIASDSLETGIKARDAHLRTDDFSPATPTLTSFSTSKCWPRPRTAGPTQGTVRDQSR